MDINEVFHTHPTELKKEIGQKIMTKQNIINESIYPNHMELKCYSCDDKIASIKCNPCQLKNMSRL